MKNGKVYCEKCSNSVVPRLWHEDMNSLIYNRSSQHICPICGVTMYSTGGGLTIAGYLGVGVVGFLLFLLLLTALYSSLGFSDSTSSDLALMTIGAFGLWYLNKRTSVLGSAWGYLKKFII